MEISRLEEYGITKGILGAECALALQGYCLFPAENFPIFLYGGERRYSGAPGVHPWVTEPKEDELLPYRDGFTMTTPERSVVDLIRIYPESEFIPEALDMMNGNYDKLYAMADRYGLRAEVEEQIRIMYDAWEGDWK